MKLSNRVMASLFAAGSVTGFAAFQILTAEEKKVETCETPVVREAEASEPIMPPEPVVAPEPVPVLPEVPDFKVEPKAPEPVRQSKVNDCGPCGMG